LAIDKGEIHVAEFSRSQVAAIGKALCDPTRLSIYIEIIKHKELYVGELAACRVISMATVSHHLRALTQAGLIMFRHSGHNVFYRAVPAQLIQYCSYLQKLVEPQCASLARAYTQRAMVAPHNETD
jgi:ArsR family transcriptional regulator